MFIRVVMLSLQEEKLRVELSCWHLNNKTNPHVGIRITKPC